MATEPKSNQLNDAGDIFRFRGQWFTNRDDEHSSFACKSRLKSDFVQERLSWFWMLPTIMGSADDIVIAGAMGVMIVPRVLCIIEYWIPYMEDTMDVTCIAQVQL